MRAKRSVLCHLPEFVFVLKAFFSASSCVHRSSWLFVYSGGEGNARSFSLSLPFLTSPYTGSNSAHVNYANVKRTRHAQAH